MANIGTLAASIALDTTKFVEGATASRSELRKVAQVMDSLATPSQRLAKEIDELTDLMIKGALGADETLQAIVRLQTAHDQLAESTAAAAAAEQQQQVIQAIQQRAQEEQALIDVASSGTQTLTAGYRGMFSEQRSGFADWLSGTAGVTAATLGTIGAVTALAAAWHNATNSAAEFVDRMQDTAKNLGTTNAEAQALSLAADTMGTDFGTVESSIRKMLATVGEAVGGDKESNGVLAKLGLSAKDLQNAGTFDAFSMVIDRLGEIATVEERAAASAEIFGKAGARMNELIGEGGEGLRAVLADVQRFGAANEAQAKAIEENIDAGKRLSAAWSGFWQQQASEGSGWAASWKVWAAEVIESFNALPAARANFQRQMEEMDKQLAEERQRSAAALIPNSASEMTAEEIQKLFDEQEKARDRTGSGALQLYESLRESVENFGKSSGQKLADDIAKANPALAERAQLLADQLAALEQAKQAEADYAKEQKRIADEAASEAKKAESLALSVETPQERFRRLVAEIDKHYAAGLLTDDIHSRLNKKYLSEMQDASRRTRSHKHTSAFTPAVTTPAAERGSQEAFQAERANRFKGIQLQDIAKQQLEIAKRQSKSQDDTVAELKRINAAEAVV